MRLAQKRAVITGAGNGQGREVALAFAREGADVTIVDLDWAAAHETLALVRAAGGDGRTACFDIADEQGWAALRDELAADGGDLHILYNNAAIFPAADRGTLDTSVAVWDQVMAVNVRGTFLACRTVVPLMRTGGSIINIASIRAWLGTTTPHNAYAASKAAVLGLGQSMAIELGPRQIRVNAICPGTIETEMAQAHNEAARALRIARYPLGRFGLPTDVAPAAVFLGSDESSWITGAVLTIDGGTSALYV